MADFQRFFRTNGDVPSGSRTRLDDRTTEVNELDTRLPHWFGPADDQPVEILSVHESHGERMHVRAAPRRTANTV